MAPTLLLDKECTPKCQSRKHADTIVSQIPRLTLQEFQAYSFLCHNWPSLSDLKGRTSIHLAASCGRIEILQWLLEEKTVDVSAKDWESGYTALHRALFYGQIAAAKLLIQYDTDLQVEDYEGLSCLEYAVHDRPAYITYSINEPNEVSTWGENINNILGHAYTHKRTHPDTVSEFRKLGLSIKQMVLCKYHSVFLSHNGLVYTCGHGQGGRLGHGDQHTVLVPQLIHSIKNQTCVEIAAGTDHTLLRMSGGTVFSCGLNTCRQLGQSSDIDSSLLPKPMKCKAMKKKALSGVCAGRFHSVLWTEDEIYTVGLNAGQLGHPKGEIYIEELQPVPSLKYIHPVAVTTSDAAIACLAKNGDVYVLHKYLCCRVAFKLFGIEQLAMTGGTLDHHTGLDMLMEKGGHELVLLLRRNTGQLDVWRETHQMVKRCKWKTARQLSVSDMAVNDSSLIVTTDKGQAYIGKLPYRKLKETAVMKDATKDSIKDSGDVAKLPRLLDRLLKEEVELVVPTRLPGIHRALKVASDRKGRNFAVVQALPNGCLSKFPSVSAGVMHENIGHLLLTVEESDVVHDAVIQLGDRKWPVHGYIVGMRCQHFHQACLAVKTKGAVFNVDDEGGRVTAECMDQVLQYIYTDTCDFLTPGFKVKVPNNNNTNTTNPKTKKEQRNRKTSESDSLVVSGKQTSAYEAHQQRKKNEKNSGKDQSKGGGGGRTIENPVQALKETAQKLGVKNLYKRLNQVTCDKGIIALTQPVDRLGFQLDRTKLPELYDVTIVTEEGREIRCHKCVLVSRLEYFYSMFATGWMETTNSTRLTLPAPGEALEILIDYLYTDDAPQLVDCSNERLLCEVLVVSDQLLAWRLKQLCEVALANIVSFKNVADLLELSAVYNADQLKETCQEFLCLNLSAVLEARILECLSDDSLQELTDYYRATIPNVSYRVFTPPSEGIDRAYLDDIVSKYERMNPEFKDRKSSEPSSDSVRKAKQAKKRGKPRIKSVSIDQEDKPTSAVKGGGVSDSRQRQSNRHASVSSDVSAAKLDADLMVAVEEINKQIELDEKKALKLKQQSSTKDKKQHPSIRLSNGSGDGGGGSSQPLGGGGGGGLPTQPEDVPSWTPRLKTLSWADNVNNNVNNHNSNNDNSSTNNNNNNYSRSEEGGSFGSHEDGMLLLSPSSPSTLATSPSTTTTTTSLRDIMRQESKTSHTPGRKQNFPSHFSRKEGKKKHKKEETDVSTPSPVSPSLTPACPWGSTISGVVSSFRDLMLKDKDTNPPPQQQDSATPTRGGTSMASSSSSSPPAGTSRSNRGRRSTPISIPLTSPRSNQPTSPQRPDNPWQKRAAETAAITTPTSPSPSPYLSYSTSPPPRRPSAALALNFSDILLDQREKEVTLIKIKQKPLALIQLEERAMAELLQYYQASQRVEDYVTVERVAKNVAAAPIWHRERRPSGGTF